MAQHKLVIQLTLEYFLDCDDGVKLMDIVKEIDNDSFSGEMSMGTGAIWYGEVKKWRITDYEEDTHIVAKESTSDH